MVSCSKATQWRQNQHHPTGTMEFPHFRCLVPCPIDDLVTMRIWHHLVQHHLPRFPVLRMGAWARDQTRSFPRRHYPRTAPRRCRKSLTSVAIPLTAEAATAPQVFVMATAGRSDQQCSQADDRRIVVCRRMVNPSWMAYRPP